MLCIAPACFRSTMVPTQYVCQFAIIMTGEYQPVIQQQSSFFKKASVIKVASEKYWMIFEWNKSTKNALHVQQYGKRDLSD